MKIKLFSKKLYFIVVLRKVIKKIVVFAFDIASIIFPINKSKIVFSSYYGRGIGDNGKYIIQELIKRQQKIEIVWLVKNIDLFSAEVESNISYVKYGSLKSRFELATAKIWIDNCRKTYFPPKKRCQTYIQTWHSPLRLKQIEKDAESNLSKEYVKIAKRDSKIIDLITSGCSYSTEIFRKAFWYKGQIINIGTPRCDIFFKNNDDVKKRVYEKFSLNSEAKICLFAPTFRSNPRYRYELDYTRVIEALKMRFDTDYVLLIRLHPNVTSNSGLIECSNRVINASDYDDMQELLVASDVLITDYSSSMFDMAIAKKKCFLYANDLNHYLETERNMYFRIDELPFSFSNCTDELVDNIYNYNELDYHNTINAFLEKIGSYEDGQATSRIVDIISSIINK